MQALQLPAEAEGHRWELIARIPDTPRARLLWLPALGVAARHYLPFAEALAMHGIAVFLHEWRGHGSSSLRAGRRCDWGYRELLALDLSASESAIASHLGGQPTTGAGILGGHSLGGQLACCRLAMEPAAAQQLWLVASGSPYWRAFPPPTRYALPLAYRFLPWLARRCGALPGRRIGFGGQEARGVIADWARSALSGRYAARGLDIDLEAALRRATPTLRAIVLGRDWLAPPSSLRFLLAKMPRAPATVTTLEADTMAAAAPDAAASLVEADHFAWMAQPTAVTSALVS